MGSRGSVIPFFLNKIKTGKLLITDEKMTRFNITLKEGVDFVDYALKTLSVENCSFQNYLVTTFWI